jgi:hypothetical protein
LKKITKLLLAIVTPLIVFSININGQTNIKGGIYSNTTWTLAKSPYIVTDTIVVFPNVTLTIQPGVVVKFADDKFIEVRQASIVAIGTAKDSILFTSNSSSATPGKYQGINLKEGSLTSKFNYCIFRYASQSIFSTCTGSLIIKNSSFNFNKIGIRSLQGFTMVDTSKFNYNVDYGMHLRYLISSRINTCSFSSNGVGLHSGFYDGKTINCRFTSNKIGLDVYRMKFDLCYISKNQIGVQSFGGITIRNSTIDSNSVTGISSVGDSIINCKIRHNVVGVQATVSTIMGCTIENNNININDNGSSGNSGPSRIIGNYIRNGNVGIDNVTENYVITENLIGIKLNISSCEISCNKICNNSSFNIKYGTSYNCDISKNYWCTNDSTAIRASIYDGYNNISLGLVSFMPLNISTCNLLTGINFNEASKLFFSIYLNPTSDILTVTLPAEISKAEVKIFNTLGDLEYVDKLAITGTKIEVVNFNDGIHVIQIISGDSIIRQKFIKQ